MDHIVISHDVWINVKNWKDTARSFKNHTHTRKLLERSGYFTVQIEIGKTCGAEGNGQITFFVSINI